MIVMKCRYKTLNYINAKVLTITPNQICSLISFGTFVHASYMGDTYVLTRFPINELSWAASGPIGWSCSPKVIDLGTPVLN